jgi:hypothetical protein
MRSFGDRDLGPFLQTHPDRNLQSPPAWVNDTDRPISPLRSANDLQDCAMKRVEGVEDLNIRIVQAQGILGVGVSTLTRTAWSPAAGSRRTPPLGILPAGTF